jgi:trans-2,3-dihydro-3-hydroxyanthranilate isomerase
VVKRTNCKAVLVFSPEAYNVQHALNARVFVDFLGIPEDPATGSANGDLAGYLVKHRYFGTDSIDIQVEQGYEINRPSLLHLRAQNFKNEIQIEVGGKTVHIAKGEWA